MPFFTAPIRLVDGSGPPITCSASRHYGVLLMRLSGDASWRAGGGGGGGGEKRGGGGGGGGAASTSNVPGVCEILISCGDILLLIPSFIK